MNAAPISAKEACRQGVEWSEIQLSAGEVYWLQFDPSSALTSVVTPGKGQLPDRLTTDDFCVRSRVYEYGGGAYCVAGEYLVLVREQDQALCRFSLSDRDSEIQILLQQPGYRYGDLVYDPHHHRLLCVEEFHPEGDLPAEVLNRLVSIDPESGQRSVLVEGADFYSSPRISQDGRRLAWLSWNHPDQPWLSTCLMEAQLDLGGGIQLIKQITGGHFGGKSESVYQPEYSEDGGLYFISDRNGWWNLYRSCELGTVTAVTEPLALELGAAQWQLGLSRYTLIGKQQAVCSFIEEGRFGLMVIDLVTGRLRRLPQRWSSLQSVVSEQGIVYTVAQYPHKGAELLKISGDLMDQPEIEVLADLNGNQLGAAAFSLPNHIQFDTAAGNRAYGFYYPAQNVAPGQQPALIIQLHGGPTAMANASYDALKQFWCQRGFALLDLNYRGSTGYGRDYRHSLHENWGVVDVEDAGHAAAHCIQQGWVDPERIYIRGGSAGGYTVLQALCRSIFEIPGFERGFRAGASLYGISDLNRLNDLTHKFETQYLYWLIGDPNSCQDRYRERSPIFAADRFSKPVIFFQGKLDRVVPAEQTRKLYDKLKSRGMPVHYVAFDQERHGFKQATNREQVLEDELSFYNNLVAADQN